MVNYTEVIMVIQKSACENERAKADQKMKIRVFILWMASSSKKVQFMHFRK